MAFLPSTPKRNRGEEEIFWLNGDTMKHSSEIRKIALVGDYLPRRCGIATFTHDLFTSVATQYSTTDCFVVPVNDIAEGYDYPAEVRFEIEEKDLDSYRRVADFLNFSNTDIVCLQHEFGIFGGPAGSHVLGLLRELRMPVVTTLHTVLGDPEPDQKRVLQQLAELSARVIVMTDRARALLKEDLAVPESKHRPDRPRHSRHAVCRSEFLQGPVWRGGQARRPDLWFAVAQQGHRVHAPGPAGGAA